MIIRISGIPNTNQYPQEQKQATPETHFYTPEEPKEEVKKDFGLTLDKEKGNQMFRSIISSLKDEVRVPEEF